MKKIKRKSSIVLLLLLLLPFIVTKADTVSYNLLVGSKKVEAYTVAAQYASVSLSASFYLHLYPDERIHRNNGSGSPGGTASTSITVPSGYYCYKATSSHNWSGGSAKKSWP